MITHHDQELAELKELARAKLRSDLRRAERKLGVVRARIDE